MVVHFYEKPGCINNTKQKQLLEEHGHSVLAHSLLTEPWTPETLRPFFGNTPVTEWFNPSAPRIKSGEIEPSDFDDDTAIEAMLEEPLLIRRPLIDAESELAAGFDNAVVRMLLGNTDLSAVQSCPILRINVINNSIKKQKIMSKQSVEELLEKGGSDKEYRIKYDNALSKEAFVELALADGYDFTVAELTAVLRENGDMFESYGNPPKKSIWIK